MARKLRVEFAGACYHVINRGNYRQNVFAPEGAAECFERCLFAACASFKWRLHAFVIMRNHFHLAVETAEPNLSLGMKWVQGTWAARLNRFRGMTGRPFQGRYKALHVEPGHALAQVCHYIHLNPVRAGVVPIAAAADYPWSSLRRFLTTGRPAVLQATTVLHESGGLPDTPDGWRRYLDTLTVVAEEEAARRDEKFGRLSRGWMIGSAEFRNGLKAELTAQAGLDARFELLGADREAHTKVRAAVWEDTLQALADAFHLNLDQLPAPKSAFDKVCLGAAMKAVTSVSNRWLATRLHLGKTSSVGALLHRFRRQGHAAAPTFTAVLSRFTT